MLPPLYIGHLYWWLSMLCLFFAHFQWSIHLSDRLCSKIRKHPDARLINKTKKAIGYGVALIVLYVGHLAVISWENVAEALMVWLGGYLMPTVLVARNIYNLRQSRREYEEILRKREQSLAIESSR